MKAFMMLTMLMFLATLASAASSRFDGFIKGKYDWGEPGLSRLYNVRILGVPGDCVPTLKAKNLTTGGPYNECNTCCDDYFWETGVFEVVNWSCAPPDGVSDGDIDELSLWCFHAMHDRQLGVWRATDKPGVFTREEIALPVAPTTWGQIKAAFR